MATWLFTRFLGLIFLIAFLSLSSQLMGLAGSVGISPVSDKLADLQAQYGALGSIVRPSMLWLNSSDNCILAFSFIGVCSSIALTLGLMPGISLLLCWTIYLSFVNVIPYFLGFQWDQMLLECGFLTLFLVPWSKFDSLWSQKSSARRTTTIFLLRWMLFRVMFCSGMAKLLGGCVFWQNFSALGYYWETQLLPTQLAWYLFALPGWIQTTGVAATFLLEIVVPFFIFATRRWRITAGILLILLQLAMLCTGNHGFINILTATLCVTLFDDQFLQRILPQALSKLAQNIKEPNAQAPTTHLAKQRKLCARTAVASFLTLTAICCVATVLPSLSVLQFFRPALNLLIGGYHLTGYYGLYPVVYTERREVIVEGSNDRLQWLPYTFKYHIGEIDRAPPSVSLYQPRLDWRMRFIALAPSSSNPWVSAFVQRLLQGSQPVLGLLEGNPFFDHPPKYIRAELYNYQFATAEEHRQTGNWWHRQWVQHYILPTTLAQPGVRLMQFAGSWYPEDPKLLQNLLEDLEKRAKLRPKSNFDAQLKSSKSGLQLTKIVAIIAPHAAYRYSGVGAMRAYLRAQEKGVKRIILLGPLHPMYKLNLHGALLPSDQAFATPLGNIQIDTEAVRRLSEMPNFTMNEKAQSIEHSLEMQLPLVRYTFKDIPIVPVLIAGGNKQENIASIANGLKSELKDGDLIIVSADMTHWGKMYDYLPFTENVRENVQKLDQEAYEHIANFDEFGFAKFKVRTKENMCGFEPISVLLDTLPKDSQADVIEYYTSQEAMPKPLGSEAERCVGYLSVGFSQGRGLKLKDR